MGAIIRRMQMRNGKLKLNKAERVYKVKQPSSSGV